MPFIFRFRLIPFIATVLLVALGVSLAQWQTRRAAEKIGMAAQLSAQQSQAVLDLKTLVAHPEQMEYRRVRVKGEFLEDWPVYLDNRPHNGVAGFYLLMPFKIAASHLHVMVARGWFARNAGDRTIMPSITTPHGLIEIEGIARNDIGRVMQLGAVTPPTPHAIVQNLDIAAFSTASGLKMQPLVVEQTGAASDGLARDWPLPSIGVERHRAYAFQWYALAAMAFLFFVVTGFRREKKQGK